MQRSCKELKRIARENLTGHYSLPIQAYLYAGFIVMLIELPFSLLQTGEAFSSQNIILYIAEFLISIAAIVLTCGEYRIHLQMARGEGASLRDLFYPLKNQPDRYILGQLLYLVFTLIAMLPLIPTYLILKFTGNTLVPLAILLALISCVLVILVSLNFNLVFFFLLDNENLTVIDAFKKCRHTMMGNKKRYLYITLSFCGIILLAVLSLGIAIFWVRPYINQTLALFYLDVTGQPVSVEIKDPVMNPYN